MIESLSSKNNPMNKYLLDDILNDRDYMEWREKINQVNGEYHNKLYYCEEIDDEGVSCTCCATYLWNWRLKDDIDDDWVRNIKFNVYGGSCRVGEGYCDGLIYCCRCSSTFDINLPKNY